MIILTLLELKNSISVEKSKMLPSSLNSFAENKMFFKLFRYISGVNSEGEEIEMTVPVISKLAPIEVRVQTL